MGLGIGIYCERCGEQLTGIDFLRENGYEYNLCERCHNIVEFNKKLT